MKDTIDSKQSQIENSGLIFESNEIDAETTFLANALLYKQFVFKVLKVLFYILMIFPSIYLIANKNDDSFSLLFAEYIIFFICCCFGLLFAYFIRKIRLKKIINDYKKNPNKSKASFYNDGLVLYDSSYKIVLFYSEFNKVELIKTYLFIYYSKNKCFTLSLKNKDPEVEHKRKLFVENLFRKKIIKNKYTSYKHNYFLGYFLMVFLTIISVLVFKYLYSFSLNNNYVAYVIVSYAFFLFRTFLIIYSRYINHLDISGVVVSLAFIFISIFLGRYIMYVFYFFPHYNMSFFELFYKLFSIIDTDLLRSFLITSSIVFVSSVLLNIRFLLNLFNDDELDLSYITNTNLKSHLSKNLSRSLFFVILTVFFAVFFLTQSFFGSVGQFIEKNVMEGFKNDNNILINRYSDKLNSLKSKDENAYYRAFIVLANQNIIYNDFNVDNYFIDSSVNSNEDVIRVYFNLDYEDSIVSYDLINFGTQTDAYWSDWYGEDNNYLDLVVSVEKKGYCIVNISNNVDDRVISVFIDNISKGHNWQSFNTAFLHN